MASTCIPGVLWSALRPPPGGDFIQQVLQVSGSTVQELVQSFGIPLLRRRYNHGPQIQRMRPMGSEPTMHSDWLPLCCRQETIYAEYRNLPVPDTRSGRHQQYRLCQVLGTSLPS